MSNIRWLQWSQYDLAHGSGGVEVHARCLAREFTNKGIENSLSDDPQDLKNLKWNVIHTHGSSIPPLKFLLNKDKKIWVHTLHGTTFGRMWACGELTWPGGYAAALRESVAVTRADVVLAVHGDLSLFKMAKRLGKVTSVCGNGWDAACESEPLEQNISHWCEQNSPFWVFIGRGSDSVKGVDRLKVTLKLLPGFNLIAVPGEGFASSAKVFKSGPLSSGQVRTLLQLAQGLILPSRYEGLPLVVLEALAYGVPVVTTNVGGIKTLSSDLQGLVKTDTADPRAIADSIRHVEAFFKGGNENMALENQKLLSTWAEVAERSVAVVHLTS